MLTGDQKAGIDRIFTEAEASGRDVLYEHEVYGILEILGLGTPRFLFVRKPDGITAGELKKFGGSAVVKIVSSKISHKKRFGGVRKIALDDPMYVRYVLEKMKEEVEGHFDEGRQHIIEGYLVTEYIPHTQAIGNEILLGFFDDYSFGPVATLSKGGDDAEFFADCYDPANLFLPPIDAQEAGRLVRSLKVRHRYAQTGHPEYLDMIADAAVKISGFAHDFSVMSPVGTEFIVKEFDINPFVFSEDGRFTAVDGYAFFSRSRESDSGIRKTGTRSLRNLFDPDGIAIIGVSLDENKYSMGREIATLLDDLGRKDLYLVNRRGGEIAVNGRAYPLYRSVAELPADTDLLIYTASTAGLESFAEELKGSAHKAMIIISALPAGTDFGSFSDRLKERLPPGLRVLGPNCMGVYAAPENGSPGINTLFIEKARLDLRSSERSNTVLLTQSGGVALTEIDRLNDLRIFKNIVSFGNKMDIDIPDLTGYFADDASAEVLSLYIEGFGRGEGRGFFDIVSKTRKPVVVYKAGRTEAGARAARSHTASMTGSYEVFRAACSQAGIIAADKIEDHYEYIKAFSLLAAKPPINDRVAFVLNAGFESTIGADELTVLKPAVLSENTKEALSTIDRYGLIDKNTSLIDMSPLADDAFYARTVELLMSDDSVGSIVVSVLPHTKYLMTDEKSYDSPGSLANLLISIWKRHEKPFVVSVNGGRHFRNFIALMERNGLPVYQDIRGAIRALEAFVDFHLNIKGRKMF